MAQTELEDALVNFEKTAMLVEDDGTRQAWRFEFQGRAKHLYFYPRRPGLGQYLRTMSAVSEFLNLQTLQKAGIPSPRAVAHLSGLRIAGTVGDAVIVEVIENALSLKEQLQNGISLNHRNIVKQMIEIINQIGLARLGQRDLGLDSFILSDGKIYFDAAQKLRRGGMEMNDLYAMAHDAGQYATRTDMIRAWRILKPDAPLPRNNPVSAAAWRRIVQQSTRENERFGLLRAGGWTGIFTKHSPHPQPWTMASHLHIASEDWVTSWKILLAQIESDQFTTIKRDASGEVLEGEIILAGRPLSIIVKRPKRKRRVQYLIDLFRPARARRMWMKAWSMIARDLPCEWPLLLMERRVLGYAVDSVIVFERVPGARLDRADLDAIDPIKRDMLFRRAGKILRTIEESGLVHYDSKSTNWIVYENSARGAIPVMIDLDGIRPLNAWLHGWGILRLLRAMKQHKQYTPADSLALCQGYAPFSPTPLPEDATTSP